MLIFSNGQCTGLRLELWSRRSPAPVLPFTLMQLRTQESVPRTAEIPKCRLSAAKVTPHVAKGSDLFL